MGEFFNRIKGKVGVCLFVCFILSACTIEEVNIFELDPIKIEDADREKNELKDDIQFISIAYRDIFQKQISNNELKTLIEAYTSMGDKAIIIDRIVRNYLNRPGAVIPTSNEMRTDIPGFIQDLYMRFFLREANEMEVWYLQKLIETQVELEPKHLIYTMMTSDEYRHY